jgi:hypothetical protein
VIGVKAEQPLSRQFNQATLNDDESFKAIVKKWAALFIDLVVSSFEFPQLIFLLQQ